MLIVTIILILALIYGQLSRHKDMPFNLAHTMPLRGILAMMVVVCHVIPYFGGGYMFTDFGVMGAPSVSCFFFLSGYGLMISLQKKDTAYFNGFFTKRLSKLLIPVFIITLIYWGILTLTGDFSWHLIGQRFAEGSGTSPKSWFIFALLACYIVFFAAFRWTKNTKYGLVLVWLFTLVLMVCASILHWSLWTLSLISFPMGVNAVSLTVHRSVVFYILTTVSIAGCLYGCYGCHIHSLPVWWPIASNTMPVAVYFAFRKIDISSVAPLIG